MFDPDAIRITDYNYLLPTERIAQFPLTERDASKLLIYDQGHCDQDIFINITSYLPDNSLLVFNDTKVIRARIFFTKPTGAQIEIFCIEPIAPTTEIQAAFQQQTASTWKCLVGNLKRWKTGILVHESIHKGQLHHLYAERLRDCGDGSFVIAFHWDPTERSFSDMLGLTGLIPLPPYIHRLTESLDTERYQTIYAAHEGAVAAPTAGLHFTSSLMQRLLQKGIECEKVTLHVGIGTFRPVSVDHIRDHVMHHEKIVITRKTIVWLLNNLHRPVFAVGTTSARTLESLYWLGVRLIREGSGSHPVVSQWYPYQQGQKDNITVQQSLETLQSYLDQHNMDEYSGETQLMIVPGYQYKLISGLITNFHMPQSTLLLLVAALIGENWKQAYTFALSNGFRFLSYGDSCLFFNPCT
jgi:S-adenosylmethionine:tRNA ribosyltransferase-isomerase